MMAKFIQDFGAVHFQKNLWHVNFFSIFSVFFFSIKFIFIFKPI